MQALNWEPEKPCLSFSSDPEVPIRDKSARFLDSSMKIMRFSVFIRVLLAAGQLNGSLLLASQMCGRLLREIAALSKHKLRIPCLRVSGLACTLRLDFILLFFLDLDSVALLSLQVVSEEYSILGLESCHVPFSLSFGPEAASPPQE